MCCGVQAHANYRTWSIDFVQHLFGTLFASIFCSSADYALFWWYLGQDCIDTETAPSNFAIYDEFSE